MPIIPLTDVLQLSSLRSRSMSPSLVDPISMLAGSCNFTWFSSPLSLIGAYSPANQDHDQSSKTATASKDAPPKARKIPNQRGLRTDRHSKICTKRGLRDRRMRLSIDVARRFFDLQDLLGFDKASATVDWLMTQSKVAIDMQLMHLNEHVVPCDQIKELPHPTGAPPHRLVIGRSRAEARARARERTNGKKGMMNDIMRVPVKDSDSPSPNEPARMDYACPPMWNTSYCHYNIDFSNCGSNEGIMNIFFSDEHSSSHLAEAQFH